MIARKLSVSALVCLSVGVPGAAAYGATLLTGNVTVGNYYPDTSTVYLGFIGSGPTAGGVSAGPYPFTFTSDTFTVYDPYGGSSFNTYGPGGFNGFILSFTGIDPITGVTFGSGAEPPTSISFDSNTIWLGYNDGPRPGGYTTLDVSFATPEPATWAMMLLGFGGLCLAGRRASRRNPDLAV